MKHTPILALALAALAALPPTAADAVATPLEPTTLGGPENAFFTVDPDGGRTLRLLLEDGVGGTYAYTRVDLSNTHETAAGVVEPRHPGAGQTIRNTREPVREAGVFMHAWTFRGSPMLTVGTYAIHDSEGLLRAPLVILENVTSTGDLTAAALSLVAEGQDMTLHAVPMLLEYALPEYQAQMERWPADANSVDTFRDYARIYAWTVRKATPAGEVWEGAYLERIGSYEGGFGPEEPFHGRKVVEVGNAIRVDDVSARFAGVYVESVVTKEPGDPQRATHRLTVGESGEPTGYVPLATVELRDSRAGVERFTFPDEQRTGIVIGPYYGDEWVPLLGTWTHATHARGAGADVEQTRLTSAGAYVQGEYVPLAGARYHGDRTTALGFANRFTAGGGPGADTTGDFEVDLGTFAAGEFVPLAGATYADDFTDARHRYQTMVTAGVHAPLGYQPLVAASYDGELPFLTWTLAWSRGDRSATLDWTVAAGTFALGRYAPVVGVRFDNAAPGSTRAYQEHYQVGTFLGHYRAFVPVVGAKYDGDAHLVAWATAFANGGTLGARVGEWDAAAGAYPLGSFRPVLETRYRADYGSGESAQSFVTVGTRGASGEFVPLAGVSYSSSRALVASLGVPTNPRDDVRAHATAGVFVQGEYVPLVMVDNRGDSTRVGVLPPYY